MIRGGVPGLRVPFWGPGEGYSTMGCGAGGWVEGREGAAQGRALGAGGAGRRA